jgi:predicted nucleic acid-binding protein
VLVLDANILIRAVLRKQVRELLANYGGRIEFVAPDVAFDEARKHLPEVIHRRELETEPFMDYFASLASVVQTVDRDTYSNFETVARQRLMRRDENDWPILAAALALRCPIWTEDTDFFGCGVATWTTDRVELHLSEVSSRR